MRSPKPDLRFANGSVIRFRHAETISHASRRQGGEYQLLLIDERTQTSPTVVSVLEERLRSSNLNIPVLGIRSGSNPGDIGHTACKARYIERTNYGESTYTDEHGFTVRFVPAKATDNPHLDDTYFRRLAAIPDPARRAAMQDGSWDAFAGSAFSEWRHDMHIVPSMLLPESWNRYAGVDWGYANPFACVWAAVDEDDRLWVYREVLRSELGEHDQAKLILALEESGRAMGPDGEVPEPSPVIRAADPAVWARRGDAEAISDAYLAEGCVIQPANNDRVAGWSRLHTYLAMGPACHYHRGLGLEECPMFHLLEDAVVPGFDTCKACDGVCRGLASHLPGAPRSKTKPEDVDTNFPGDHDLDAGGRYLIMSIGRQPEYFWPSDVGNASNGRQMAIDGQTPLAEPYGGLFALPPGQAQGPRSNGYGWS